MRHFLSSFVALAALAAAQQPQYPQQPQLPNTRDPLPLPLPIPVPVPVPVQQPDTQLPPSGVTVIPATVEPAPQPTISFDRPVVIEPRVCDITTPHNVMAQPLVGLGLVVGLPKTGSTDRASREALLNFIQRKGLNVTMADVTGGATALVTVTAELPPFANVGDKVDIKCAAIGVVESLRYGVLLLTDLQAVDGETYAQAQGQLFLNAITEKGTNAKVTSGASTTTGWVSKGGQVVKPLESSYWSESGALELRLLNPGVQNATAIADAVRSVVAGSGLDAVAVSPSLVRIPVPAEKRTHQNALDLLRLIANVRVRTENPATVVIDQSVGTVIAGEGVLISPCVVGFEDFTVSVTNEDQIVQPNAFARGETARSGRTRIEMQNNSSGLKPVTGGATVGDLLTNLKALGLSPNKLAAVFIALDTGHYLQARLELR